jgi:hypothetical protein
VLQAHRFHGNSNKSSVKTIFTEKRIVMEGTWIRQMSKPKWPLWSMAIFSDR